MKGLTLSNSKLIRQVHNSYARQQVFEYDEKSSKSEDSYHFVGYIPIEGRLYELDGLKPGPIDHGAITTSDWIEAVRPVIQKRISSYNAGEIHFNLMAVVGDKIMMTESKMKHLNDELTQLTSENSMETADGHAARIALIQTEIEHCHEVIRLENNKRNKFKIENTRRKHNYLPFIIEMIRILAAEEKLMPLVETAKKKMEDKAKTSQSTQG
uniref:ubiquitinyl hydrolase 1 n=1 Tax=Phallusia mammillata TaxID=59560 RepID=A0A6F9DVL5_9ASCI|nr:ubiquitin carboxyl-terminal hydrolase isozyme L5-like [Phallusia mammillata]